MVCNHDWEYQCIRELFSFAETKTISIDKCKYCHDVSWHNVSNLNTKKTIKKDLQV